MVIFLSFSHPLLSNVQIALSVAWPALCSRICNFAFGWVKVNPSYPAAQLSLHRTPGIDCQEESPQSVLSCRSSSRWREQTGIWSNCHPGSVVPATVKCGTFLPKDLGSFSFFFLTCSVDGTLIKCRTVHYTSSLSSKLETPSRWTLCQEKGEELHVLSVPWRTESVVCSCPGV